LTELANGRTEPRPILRGGVNGKKSQKREFKKRK